MSSGQSLYQHIRVLAGAPHLTTLEQQVNQRNSTKPAERLLVGLTSRSFCREKGRENNEMDKPQSFVGLFTDERT